MAQYNVNLNVNDFHYGSMLMEFHNRQPADLKRVIKKAYEVKKSSVTNKAKKASALLAMFTATEDEPEKQQILDEVEFACFWLHCSMQPYLIYRALLILTFPLLREIEKTLPTFKGNMFTPDILADKITETEFASDVTKRDCISKALQILLEVGCVKKLKKGLLKPQVLPLVDAPSLEACLLAASVLGEGDVKAADSYLQGLSFEITHEFVDYYQHIDYESIVPHKVWNDFIKSETKYTLQYKQGTWEISDKPYLYLETNQPISFFERDGYATVEDIKAAKMRKNEWDAHKALNSHGKNV